MSASSNYVAAVLLYSSCASVQQLCSCGAAVSSVGQVVPEAGQRDGATGAPRLGNPEDITLLKAAHLHSNVAVAHQLDMPLQAVCPALLFVAVLLPTVDDQHQLHHIHLADINLAGFQEENDKHMTR